MYGYLGPNGAGKTTSLRMLLGLIRPSSGSARLFGRDPMIDGVRALEGVAGFVEAPRFYPYLSGRKNLELVAALDGGDARRQIDAALDTVDLTSRAKDRVGGYSHGMRQRLGIAGALIRQPRLLLLDEPATGLDPAGMRDMRALIRSLAESGITVLLSSHLMNEVEELCNRVAIIRSGRIVYEGRLDELRASAAGSYTLRTSDDARGRADLREPAGHPRLRRRARRPAPARRRGGDRGAQPRAGARGHRAARARAGRRLARGAVLRAHRGSRRVRRARGRAASWSGWRDAAHAHRLPLGAAQAGRAEAHLPRPGRGDDRPHDLRRRDRVAERLAQRRAVRPLRPRLGPGRAARPAHVRLDLAVPADRLARGRATSSPPRTATARSRRSSRAASRAGSCSPPRSARR